MTEDYPQSQPSLVHALNTQPLDTHSSSSEANGTNPKTKTYMKNKPSSRKLPIILLGIVVVLAVFVYLGIVAPARRLMVSVRQIQSSGQQVVVSLKAQDLAGTQKQLKQVKTDLDVLDKNLQGFAWAKFVPFARDYYFDGQHGIVAANEILAAGNVTIDAIAPYADIIGLKGLGTTGDGAKTAQDRINFIINTLDKIKPQLTQIGDHLHKAKLEVDQINPGRYPEEFRGLKIRSQLSNGISTLDQASSLVNDAKPLLESAPYMLGLKSPRKYLVIFQNDAELRPTGGFMTAYAILQVDKGKISTVQSDDIYALDAKFTKKIAAPAPIKKYLPNVPYWYLRDQNLSPDFKVSMDTFFPNYKSTNSPEVDGIIAMDTQVLVDLLKITGPIGVPGIGNFSAETDKRCNCPQAFYELELFADVEGPVVWDSISGQIVTKPKNYGERKSFIGPMTYSILSNVMAQPKNKMGDLFNTTMSLIQSKHILFYYVDPTTQTAVETFNMAGRVQAEDANKDYLMVVDTNFAGAKTNAWVNYSADKKVEIASDGTVTNTLTLTYKNPQQYFEDPKTKLKLNGVFRDWLRVYVPKGSQLIEAKGFETGQASGEDLGKTVFEGFFTLTPLNIKTITLKYKLPFKVKSPYQLLIQKQGGTQSFNYKVSVNGKSQPEFPLSFDKELSVSY
jgi:hypothetical protein